MTFGIPLTSLSTEMAHVQLRLILDSEIISSKTGIVILQNDAGTVHRICKDLSPRVLDDLEIMPQPLTWCSQIFVSSLIYQPPASPGRSPGGHSGIALDAPYACQTPRHPSSQAPRSPAARMLVEWDIEILRSQHLHRRWTHCWLARPSCWATAQSPGSSNLWRSWSMF